MVERAVDDSHAGQSLADAVSWAPQEDHRFLGHVHPVWGQGRAIYGGVVGAGTACAMGATIPSEKTLRSFAIAFVGPVQSGAVECTTEVIREGRNATFVTAKVVQDGTPRATASATFGGERDLPIHLPGVPRPDVPPPGELPEMPYFEGLLPRFLQRLELRWSHGSYPFSGSEGSTIGGWCRFRHDQVPANPSNMLALIDAWPAPALQGLQAPAPASSMTWSVDFVGETGGARLDDWWYFDARTVFTANGYTSFEASLWAPDGQYVARSSQLVGIFA